VIGVIDIASALLGNGDLGAYLFFNHSRVGVGHRPHINAPHKGQFITELPLQLHQIHPRLLLQGLQAVQAVLYESGDKLLNAAATVQNHRQTLAVEVINQPLEGRAQLLVIVMRREQQAIAVSQVTEDPGTIELEAPL